MIEIFTGPAEAVRAAVFERARGAAAPALLVDSQSSPDRSWNGLLGLLSQVAAAAGEERLLSRLARDGSAAGLLLDELAWPAADERRRQGFRAHLTSHLSHNWAVQKPLFDAWAEILAGLLEDTPGRLAVPDLGRLDWESLAVLKALYRRPRTPELLLGYDPQPAAPEPDERGLLWTLPREYALDAFLGFRSLPRVTCREVPPARGAQTGELLETGRQDPPEWDLESRAWRRLADSRPLSAEEVEQVVEAQRRAFHRFGFTSVLRLGLALFDRRAELSPRQTASVHARLALAAHNRQFHSAGNLRLAEVLDHHLRLALAAEDRPAVRSALFYRLAVTAGRRRGRVQIALFLHITRRFTWQASCSTKVLKSGARCSERNMCRSLSPRRTIFPCRCRSTRRRRKSSSSTGFVICQSSSIRVLLRTRSCQRPSGRSPPNSTLAGKCATILLVTPPVPDSSAWKRKMRLTRLDLPAPERPTSPTFSPPATVSETLSSPPSPRP